VSVVALVSARGAPGVTTCAVAMTLLWPRPALLAECDPAGGSSVLAGYLRGRVPHDRGLVGLAVAQRRDGLPEALWSQTLPLAQGRRLLPGPVDAAQAASLPPVWSPLAGVLRSLGGHGTDVIVDAGRLGAAHGPLPVLRQADLVLLVLRSSLDAVAAARARVAALREDLAGLGRVDLSLLVVGDGRPYTAREITGALDLPVVAALPFDPASAEVFSAGAPTGRRFAGSPLVRALRAAVDGAQAVAGPPGSLARSGAAPTEGPQLPARARPPAPPSAATAHDQVFAAGTPSG